MNYRDQAQKLLENAKKELETNDNTHLKYAALELRMVMEAITYDRAIAFKDEFPPNEYKTWQPRKVMSVLLEITDLADQDCTVSYRKEGITGKTGQELKSLGTENVLNMSMLKDHYDALGSYLHMSTPKQSETGKFPDFIKMRKRCEEIAALLSKVLSSRVFNITLGNFATINCSECDRPIRKRIPHGKSEFYAECFGDDRQCPASYTVIVKNSDKVEWRPNYPLIECANNDCKNKIGMWSREIKIDSKWTCAQCNGQNIIVLDVRFEPGIAQENNQDNEVEEQS